MEVQQEVKSAIKELPAPERVIAVALKAIYDEIKELHCEEKKEVDANHLNFIDKFKEIEKKASEIVKGKVLTQDELGNDTEYFVSEEGGDKAKIMAEKTKLNNYWLKVLKNSNYKNMINETDQKILSSLEDISTVVTTDTFEVTFEFSDSELTVGGSYTRKLTLTNGQPTSFSGDPIKFKAPISEACIFEYLTQDTTTFEAVREVFGILSQLINEVVPYSLEYYMGTCQNDDDFDDLDDELDDEDSEERGEPQKRVKE